MIPCDYTLLSLPEECVKKIISADVQALRTEAEKIAQIPVEHVEKLSYERFLLEYMVPNKPVLLKGLNTPHFQPCSLQWLHHDTQKINFDALLNLYGDEIVTVAYCNSSHGYDQERIDKPLGEALKEWKNLKESGITELDPLQVSSHRVPYVKDWHLARKEGLTSFYRLPVYFAEDWLNNFFDRGSSGDDYRFVYLGPRTSWTPLHSDVLCSYSWSYNVSGRKVWFFYPPSDREKIQDPFSNYHTDVRVPPEKRLFPNWNSARWIEVTQEAGEAIFVPSGWHHQVHNLEDTISINHNWGNAYNLDLMWKFIFKDYLNLRNSIEDLRDTFDSEQQFEDHCQLLLRVNAGFNFSDFADYLNKSDELLRSKEMPRSIRECGLFFLHNAARTCLGQVPDCGSYFSWRLRLEELLSEV